MNHKERFHFFTQKKSHPSVDLAIFKQSFNFTSLSNSRIKYSKLVGGFNPFEKY